MSFVRDYSKVKRRIQKKNSVCVYDITIAGEGIIGSFSMGVILQQMRIHIQNDTFHPFLFRYLCGASVGSIIIDFLLKIWFLYEMQPDVQFTLDFIDTLESVITFDKLRNIFAHVDTDQVLDTTNLYKALVNFANTGGLLVRSGIIRLLRLEYEQFQRFRPYFATDAFFKWRKPRLNYVFIAVQSAETTVGSIYTGNWRLFKTESKLIQFRKLTNSNFEHIILCSATIPIVFESLKVDGIENTIDGSSLIRNLMHIPYILHNFSYYNNVERVFIRLLDFFDIKTNDFVIHNDVLNSQTYFETVPIFRSFANKPLNAIWNIINRDLRRITASNENHELSSIAYTQPFVSEFSSVDANEIKGVSYDYNVSILNKPENRNKVLTQPYDKDSFSLITSLLPLSCYIYDSRTFLHRGLTIRLVDTNTFIRTLYTVSDYLTYVDVPLNINPVENNEKIQLLLKSGIIQSNVIYEIYKKRMSMDWNDMTKTIQTAYDNFLGDIVY
jgi:hypothetical protein